MSNVIKYKTFVRYTPKGTIIPGYVITRKVKPLHGNWKEIPSTTCCTDYQMFSVPSGYSNSMGISLYVNGGTKAVFFANLVDNSITNFATLLLSLKRNFDWLGSWTTDNTGTEIELNLKHIIGFGLNNTPRSLTMVIAPY